MNSANCRRQFGRRTTCIQAWLVVPGRPRVPCLVRNMTAKGAFLECVAPGWLPFRFEIQIDGAPRPIVCEIRHVRPDGIGVWFSDEEEMTATDRGERQSSGIIDVEHWTGRQMNERGGDSPASIASLREALKRR